MTVLQIRCANCENWEPLPGAPRRGHVSAGVCPIRKMLTSWLASCESFTSKVIALRARDGECLTQNEEKP